MRLFSFSWGSQLLLFPHTAPSLHALLQIGKPAALHVSPHRSCLARSPFGVREVVWFSRVKVVPNE